MMWRRRRSVVHPRQQIWFGLEFVFVAIGFVILCAFLMFIPPMSQVFVEDEMSAGLLTDMIQMIFLQWPWVMAAMAVLFAIGVLMAHRLFGPIRGLENALDAWGRGDRSARVHFRKYDYLLGIQEPLNQYFSEQEVVLQKMEAIAKELAANPTAESTKDQAKALLSLLEPKKEDS